MKPTNKTIDEHGNIILTCETRWLFGFIKTTHKFIATKESPSGYWNWMRLPNLTNVKYPFVLQLDAWCRNFNMVEGSSLKSTQPTPSVKRTGVLMNAIISLLERKFFPDYNAVKKENVRLKQDIYNLVENKDSLIGLEVYLYYKAKYELKATETYLILCQMDAGEITLQEAHELILHLFDVSGSLPLAEMGKRLDEALAKETPETLRKWLEEKRK